MRPARILMVSWEYPPVVEGGLARAVGQLAERLVADGGASDVHVLTRGAPSAPPRERSSGVHVHRVAEPPRPDALPAFLRWVRTMNDNLLARGHAIAAEHAVDVVHGHDWLVAVAAKRLADAVGAPFVAHVHATEHGRHGGWVHRPPQSDVHRTERWMVHVAERVVVCSESMREHVAGVFGLDRARVAVAPNGIAAASLRPVSDLAALRAGLAAPGERLVLLAGRLVYEKGFQHALEALAGPGGVIARVPGVRFVVAGAGPYAAELAAQAERLGLGGHGTFLGWVGADVLAGLYRVADVTVVPSLYEPFGLVALEAMASGSPCVVSDTGGLRELVPDGRAGLRFPPGDALALADRLERLLTDAALRDRLIAGAAEQVRRYDAGAAARRMAEVYAGLLADAAPRALAR